MLASASEDELADAGLSELASIRAGYQWSGMLPSPDSFSKYDERTRERICRWNDSFTIDESRRQDRLVECEIRQQRAGAWMSFALFALFALLAFVAFLANGSAHAFWFLTVPGLTIVREFLQPVFSKSSRK